VLTLSGHQLQKQAAHIPGCVVAQSGLPLGEVIALNRQIRKLRAAMQTPANPSNQTGKPAL
jgi:hypothetical protein